MRLGGRISGHRRLDFAALTGKLHPLARNVAALRVYPLLVVQHQGDRAEV